MPNSSSMKRYSTANDYFFTTEGTFVESGSGEWAPVSGPIAVQCVGTASSVSFTIERSSRDPDL
jgi:hypothetical protein